MQRPQRQLPALKRSKAELKAILRCEYGQKSDVKSPPEDSQRQFQRVSSATKWASRREKVLLAAEIRCFWQNAKKDAKLEHFTKIQKPRCA